MKSLPASWSKALLVLLMTGPLVGAAAEKLSFPDKAPLVRLQLPGSWNVTRYDGEWAAAPKAMFDQLSPQAAEAGDYPIRVNITTLVPVKNSGPADGLVDIIRNQYSQGHSEVEFAIADETPVDTVNGLKILRIFGTARRKSDGLDLLVTFWILCPTAKQSTLKTADDFSRAGQGPRVMIAVEADEASDQKYDADLTKLYQSFQAAQ
jgi:hypothetical protein